MMRSFWGFLLERQRLRCPKNGRVLATHQSVSSTAAVWPRNKGIWSGSFPRSFRGMTAKAPPPLDSQLTERYSGFTCRSGLKLSAQVAVRSVDSGGGRESRRAGGADQGNDPVTYLYQVGVPGIAADVEVVIAKLLLGGLPKDVSWAEGRSAAVACGGCRCLVAAQRSGAEQSTRAELRAPTIFRRAHESAGHLDRGAGNQSQADTGLQRKRR
jgi:hypothetical protein